MPNPPRLPTNTGPSQTSAPNSPGRRTGQREMQLQVLTVPFSPTGERDVDRLCWQLQRVGRMRQRGRRRWLQRYEMKCYGIMAF